MVTAMLLDKYGRTNFTRQVYSFIYLIQTCELVRYKLNINKWFSTIS